MAVGTGVATGIGAGNAAPCLGRPARLGSDQAALTCPHPARWLLVCEAYGETPEGPGPLTLVVGMCAEHRPGILRWAERHYGDLGDGLVVPIEDAAVLMRELLADVDGPEIVSPLTGWEPVEASA